MSTGSALKPLNSYQEVADYFGVCRETVERWARKGKFGLVIKVDGSVRISRDAVEACLAAHTVSLNPVASSAREAVQPRARKDARNSHRRQDGERGVGPMRAAMLRRAA